MTGWQPVPSADFCKDNHKLPREGKLPVDISYFIYHNLSAKPKKGF